MLLSLWTSKCRLVQFPVFFLLSSVLPSCLLMSKVVVQLTLLHCSPGPPSACGRVPIRALPCTRAFVCFLSCYSRALAATQDDLPVDPNEPVYCICMQVSYGEMVGCDNPSCDNGEMPPREVWRETERDDCCALLSHAWSLLCLLSWVRFSRSSENFPDTARRFFGGRGAVG